MRYGNSFPRRVDIEEYELADMLSRPIAVIFKSNQFLVKNRRVALAHPNMTIKEVKILWLRIG